MPTQILYGWPFAGLALSVVIVAFLEFDRRRHDEPWTHPATALGYLWPMYLFHQFEEHGVDLVGRSFHFIDDLCTALGRTTEACVADPEFVFAVNPGACWIAFALAMGFRRKNPSIAIAACGVPAINCVSHFSSMVRFAEYNSGLGTCFLLFIPGVTWVLYTLSRAGYPKAKAITLMVTSGLVVHVILIASLLLRDAGLISQTTLYAVNVLNGFTALLCAKWLPARPAEFDRNR